MCWQHTDIDHTYITGICYYTHNVTQFICTVQMFEDIALKKIPAKNVDRPFASGGFCAVYKVKHPFVSLYM